ncbi:hypothetical protein CVT26_002456 [Gymnopilus dilepis]|uniref:Uncharacterized protein n=1 Tax=Gymnopilus dilepis TaxID=231916 RepID=A0A409VT45_9AGAR|nr:hypothetical protein CVT26_002456 [Gymnopilus dilepis]
MPRQNASQKTILKRNSPYSTLSRQPRKYYVGPLTQADEELKGKCRTKARAMNEQRIYNALLLLAPRQGKNCHVCEHDLSWVEPSLCTGQNNPWNIGKWGVRCFKCNQGKGRTYWVQEVEDPSLISDNRELQNWFAIRREIDNLKNTGRTPTVSGSSSASVSSIRTTATRQGQLNTTDTIFDLPSSPTSHMVQSSRSSKGPALPIQFEVTGTYSGKFDKGLPIVLQIWKENFMPSIEVTLYSRQDSRVRLADYKVELGVHGFELGSSLEVYHWACRQWLPSRWDTPHLVAHPGQFLFARIKGVHHLERFDEVVPWAFPNLSV